MQRRLLPGTLLSVSCAIILSACATLTPTLAPEPPSAACGAFKLIGFDRLNDTDETLVQVKRHNAVWRCLCTKECKDQARVPN
jgi:succinate dehydrogenase/fumarate reductase-like Fe-S protein